MIEGCDGQIELDDFEGFYSRLEHDFVEKTEILSESGENTCYGDISNLLSCDFETDSRCGWALNGFRKWHGETYTPQTGPKNAHSGKNYIYLESSEINIAKLESFHIPAGTSLCLQFRFGLQFCFTKLFIYSNF